MKELKEMTADELLEAVKKEKDESIFLEIVRNGGELLNDEKEGDQRVLACHGCPNVSIVEPLPFKRYIGCSLCGCPFASKAYMLSFLGKKADCPHPEGSRWENIKTRIQND